MNAGQNPLGPPVPANPLFVLEWTEKDQDGKMASNNRQTFSVRKQAEDCRNHRLLHSLTFDVRLYEYKLHQELKLQSPMESLCALVDDFFISASNTEKEALVAKVRAMMADEEHVSPRPERPPLRLIKEGEIQHKHDR